MTPEPLRCGCCERPVSRCDLRRLTKLHEVWNMPELMCSDCFVAWYDGGMTDPEQTKAHVLAQEAREA